jgi:hypothetical protein
MNKGEKQAIFWVYHPRVDNEATGVGTKSGGGVGVVLFSPLFPSPMDSLFAFTIQDFRKQVCCVDPTLLRGPLNLDPLWPQIFGGSILGVFVG